MADRQEPGSDAPSDRGPRWRRSRAPVTATGLGSSVAVRPIRIIGDPVLHTPTCRVEVFDDALRELVADMFDTMAAAAGVGLAANQVGVSLRLFVYDCPDEELHERRRGVVV